MRAAAQDLEMQIEEQKLKIQNTPNQILRVSTLTLLQLLGNVFFLKARFETFLQELEKQHKGILDQVSVTFIHP